MAEPRTCAFCKGVSWSANTTGVMPCAYCGKPVQPVLSIDRRLQYARLNHEIINPVITISRIP